MELTQSPSTAEAVPAAADAQMMSPFARAIGVFTNPAAALAGLRTQSQWWFPLLVIVAFSAALTAAIYDRAVVPMTAEIYDRLVDQGVMSAEQASQAVDKARGTQGLVGAIVGRVMVFYPLILLVMGAAVAFGVSFITGKKLPFRQGFEVVLWANLIMLPAGVITGIMGWMKETLEGIHLSLAALVPMSDPPEKWHKFVVALLDAFGPFEIWTVAVVIIGASVLSGASRKSVFWVVGGLYVLLRVAAACLAMVVPG